MCGLLLRDLEGRLVPVVESERTLGFDLGPGVTTSSVVASRGQTMSSRMHQYKIIWQSDLPVKKTVEKYKLLSVGSE